ncbi:MAG: alpha/beta hydrolase [Betaproteobacteria bacterium]
MTTAKARAARQHTISDLRGVSRLAVDAVAGVTGIVEAMHRNITGSAPIVGRSRTGATSGITGLVYRGVRGVTNAVGIGLDAALGRLSPLLKDDGVSPRREALLAALNGVFGDYLVASGNPLAIPMGLRQEGRLLVLDRQSLAADIAHPADRLLVMVHGLGMNDLQWQREGHNHGASLARDLGYTALYLHYNSGRHVSTNGREFSTLLEQLVQQWPVPVRELVIIGHSMGGLVARSACHYARLARCSWRSRLKKLVFLGTPHHGAPLERAGNWVDILVGISPYTAPFARLGMIRSAGIKDLRYGSILDEDWDDEAGGRARDPLRRVPLPRGVQCFAVAATRASSSQGSLRRLPGDGLVPVMSALGWHKDPARTLAIPESRQAIFHGSSHFDLLSRHDVYERIRDWL